MLKRFPFKGYGAVWVSEVGKILSASLGLLAKDDIFIGTMQRFPLLYPSLQGSQYTLIVNGGPGTRAG